MNCVEVNQHLESAFDEALEPEMKKAVMLHLRTCSSCQAGWDEMQALRSVLQGSSLPAPSASLDERVLRAFNQAHLPRTKASLWWQRLIYGSINIPRPVFAAALVVFALALALATYIGRLTARPFSVATLPTAIDTDNIKVVPQPPQIIYVPVKAQRGIEHQAPHVAQRSSITRRIKPENSLRPTPAQPLESFTLVSATGANYTTNARLKGFEPLTSATVRVIKGRGE